jgi:hypothetical protein
VKCLQSIHAFLDQVFVIDSDSTDQTAATARQYAEVVNLPYDHSRIIPWIFQWGLDNLPIRNDWVMILEADQKLSPALRNELRLLFAKSAIAENGFYIRRIQVFRGRLLRFGGYGSKYMVKLFRRSAGELDPEETDTRVYVKGEVGKLKSPIVEENVKENDILFYLEKHLRYIDAFAREEFRRGQGVRWKVNPRALGTPDERLLWLKGIYYRLPLYVRPFLYFIYRYVILLGILDGKQGGVFHFLQAFWFRLMLDIRLEEIQKSAKAASTESRESSGPTTR